MVAILISAAFIGAAIIKARRLFEARRWLEEIQYCQIFLISQSKGNQPENKIRSEYDKKFFFLQKPWKIRQWG